MLIQRYPVIRIKSGGLPACWRHWRQALAAGLALVLAAAQAPAQIDAATVMLNPRQVAEGVWMVQGAGAMASAHNQGFVSNAGFIVTGEGVVVVDALGTPALARALLAEIARVTPQPVKYVVVTHYHADHIYGLQALQAAGAKVVAHAAARDYIGSDTARNRLAQARDELFPWVDERTRVATPDLWLTAPLTLTLGGTAIEVVPVGPAHTPEDVIVRVPARGVVFAGDLVFNGRVPFVGNADSRAWLRALDDLIAAAPRVLVPGHGPSIAATAAADLRRTHDYLSHLRRAMGQAAREMEPFEDAYAKADWSRFRDWPLFEMVNRMNAYNTYLLLERQGRD